MIVRGDDAVIQVAYILPAQCDAVLVSLGRADAVAGVARWFLAEEADPDEALGSGEDNAPVAVIPSVSFVLVEHGELHAVDGAQFVEGEAEAHGSEYVDFDQGLAAGVVGAQGHVTSPVWSEPGEEGRGKARVSFGPSIALKTWVRRPPPRAVRTRS